MPDRTPAEVSERHEGRDEPEAAAQLHVYELMPPLPAMVTDFAMPTDQARLALVVVIDGAAGIVMVVVPVLVVSAIDVAVMVTVCDELVAAGAVKVAELVVVLESVPLLVLQVTPALFLSWATVAVSVAVSPPSTVAAEGVTVMLMGFEMPPQPAKK